MARIRRLRVPVPTPVYDPVSSALGGVGSSGHHGQYRNRIGSAAGPGWTEMGEGVWDRLDRVQVLGNDYEGHEGCVNAISWSLDGSTLLSGSDDKRICIWTADESSHFPTTSSPSSSSSSSFSPHPLRLSETIATGHRANIFSARFLPHTATPTIVSCAGDRDVRVLEVERLARAPGGLNAGVGGMRGGVRFAREGELWGYDGAGVTVLKCHTDRTKKIATENSPHLFLTVSEDGTVRQHDLRRPHRCRSECPDALFHGGVDLYSLSVSTVTPHIFAVAGKTDAAFICDRRMPERQTPSWGSHTRSSGQVHCVRRLGLSEEEWKSVPGPAGNSLFSGERHITCVKISPHHADEVICAFAQHSTSLFSINDSPGPSNIRNSSSSSTLRPNCSSLPPLPRPIHGDNSSWMTLTEREEMEMEREKMEMEANATHMKRRISEVSTANADPGDSERRRIVRQARAEAEGDRAPGLQLGLLDEEDGMDDAAALEPSAGQTLPVDPSLSRPVEAESPQVDNEASFPLIGPTQPSPSGAEMLNDAELQAMAQDIVASYHDAIRDGGPPDEPGEGLGPQPPARRRRRMGGRIPSALELLRDSPDPTVRGVHDTTNGGSDDIMDDMRELLMEEEDAFDDADISDLDEEIDIDNFDIDEADEDEVVEDDDEFMDFWDEDEGEDGAGMFERLNRSAEGLFGGVEMVLPRRVFKGARNYETVKDCNFLGFDSDKVCSGSDDGNFFVWDKDTGRLVGIWEGDGTVVNVIEQHPTLPLVASSGIDDTVKIFAPTSTPPDPSFARLHLSDSILRANAGPPQRSSFGGLSLLDLISSGELVAMPGERADVPGCATQ